MLAALERWIRGSGFEDSWVPLEVPPEDIRGNARDLLERVANSTRDAVAQFESALAAAERRRAAEENRAPVVGPAASEQEMRTLARNLLPSLDALDRIIELGETQGRTDPVFLNWLISVKGLRARLTKSLEGIGLTALASVGTEVDLEKHDVVSVVPAGEFPANTVVAESQRGYYFRGKLLRDAKVVVAQ